MGRAKGPSLHTQPWNAGEEEIKKAYERLLAKCPVQNEPVNDPERAQTFEELAGRAMQMAEELMLEATCYVKYYIGEKRVGVVELTAKSMSIDESCPAAVRQTMAELFCTADPIWMEAQADRWKMTFAFKLWKEEKDT